MVDKKAVLQMMNEADAVYLATVNEGGPRVRALVNLRQDRCPASEFCRGEGFTVYFSTSLASGKIGEIRANHLVAAYYSDPGRTRGIELRGPMEIVTDPGLKKTLWQKEWDIYWRKGVDDPDYVVLRLKPVSAEGWWGAEPFRLEIGGA